MFNDSDDISHKDRLHTVRNVFISNPETDVIYSTFKVIDENAEEVQTSKITESILEILESHKQKPPEGKNVWIDIATRYGYINLTSCTSVKTNLAYEIPFPEYWCSEDAHTWLRYSASGGGFYYSPDIPSLYRIPQNIKGSSSRSREGGDSFYKKLREVLDEAFRESMKIALKKKSISNDETDDLYIKFYLKLAETMKREKQIEIADQLIS